MVSPECTKCGRIISRDDVNVANDVAYCRTCNISHRLSELTHEEDDTDDIDLQHPPEGAWMNSERGVIVIGASHRNLIGTAGLIFAALFVNSILSVFLSAVLASVLHLCGLRVPDWFAAPKMNGQGMGVGMTIILCLFLTPFILIGLHLAGTALSSLLGRTEVRISGAQASIFTGIGPIGWKRHFDPRQVKSYNIVETYNRNSTESCAILAETSQGKQIKFGSLLTKERCLFVLTALRKTLRR